MSLHVTPNGDRPTRTMENTVPLKAGGRASLVWFNQASMFMQSEMEAATIAEAKAAGRATTSDFKTQWGQFKMPDKYQITHYINLTMVMHKNGFLEKMSYAKNLSSLIGHSYVMY